MDVFDNGKRDPQLIPMDLPAGPDYVLGPGDGLAIDLWGGASPRLYRTVDTEGRVSLPEVGPVFVRGKSLEEVQERVQQLLRDNFGTFPRTFHFHDCARFASTESATWPTPALTTSAHFRLL